MSGTVNNVTRTQDASGDAITAFEKADGGRVQGFAPDPEVCGEVLDRAITLGVASAEQLDVKASEGRLFQVDILMETPFPTDRWLMVFDSAAAVVNTAEPIWRARVGGGFASIDFGLMGLFCATGIQVALSTTPGQLTLPGGGEGFFQVGYL